MQDKHPTTCRAGQFPRFFTEENEILLGKLEPQNNRKNFEAPASDHNALLMRQISSHSNAKSEFESSKLTFHLLSTGKISSVTNENLPQKSVENTVSKCANLEQPKVWEEILSENTKD